MKTWFLPSELVHWYRWAWIDRKESPVRRGFLTAELNKPKTDLSVDSILGGNKRLEGTS